MSYVADFKYFIFRMNFYSDRSVTKLMIPTLRAAAWGCLLIDPVVWRKCSFQKELRN